MIIKSWTDVDEFERFGIVIYNFQQDEPHRLKLTVGESVHISQENGDWYFGNSTKNKFLQGIFPKSYVKIMESVLDKSGPSEEVVLKQPKVVQEITSVLREWGEILKILFVENNEHFKTIKSLMYELMAKRSQIISGKFPVDELKQIQRIVASKIDVGNNLLGLDMVVRDDQGNILNPELTSTVRLFRHHQVAKERILRATSEPIAKEDKKQAATQQYCHALYVSIREFVCKVTEDFELLMCLYDVKEGRPFTENHIVRLSKGSLLDSDQPRVFFTDLGTRDILREKVYLVCYVVRLGGMENTSKTPSKSQPPPPSELMRRPFGVAAKDITLYVNGKLEPAEEDTIILPLLMCEKDHLDGTLKRILTIKDLTHKDHKGYGLSVRLKMLHGDLKQVREENPHLVLGQIAVARKMGFPEVILPGDVRNDLYLTLVSGEFSKGSKSTDKNVQVTLHVCNEAGQILKDVIQSGGDTSEYRSVVYYHEDKPRWAETCKIAVPIEEFKASHLRFTFKHRSSNETKDKNEKPFAMSFVNLMQSNGTTLPDTQHELLVYKIDHKKFDSSDMSYLTTLPSRRVELEEGTKPSCNGLVLTNKDSFTIQTNVCSTKLTQNIDLLGLLNWTSEPDQILQSLEALIKKVSGEEIVKFLQDVLDALFNILMENTDSDQYDKMVFNCLLHIIGLVSDRKYEHFEPVLDLYIKEGFCATLAHDKLIRVLMYHIDNVTSLDPSEREVLLKTTKSLQYIMRFIVRSRVLFSELNGGKDEEEFTESLKEVLEKLGDLMRHNTDTTLLVQGACLKYLPTTIPDILLVFNPILLSQLLARLVDNVPYQRLTKQKMMTLSDIVHSPLFSSPDARKVILRIILLHVRELLEAKDENTMKNDFRNKTKSVAKVAKVLGESEAILHDVQDTPLEPPVELCVNILGDILELLFRDDIGPTVHDLQVIMHTVLRTVIQAAIAMDREGPLVGSLVAIMLGILRQMGAHHFEDYISKFPTRTDLLDFLMEILLVFKDLVSRPVFPRDWSEMIMLQNSIILKSLRFFSHTIRDHFSAKFEHQAWNNFFHCAISFLTQPALQLETFSENKRRRIIARYKDMRMETGFEIRSMWFNLGQNKKQFIPGLVGPFLEMTLIPETELRTATLPIFFDMMQCEFYSPRNDSSENRRDSAHIKANFIEFENEMISKLDNLVEAGRGDEQYKDLFYTIVSSLCENHNTLKDQGLRFVKTVTRLMERLLEYRCIIHDENKENRMSCTVNLLDFYSEINRKQMYIRYLNKLCDLHLECDNYTEAAYTLKLHAKLLSWSDTNLSSILRSSKYPGCSTHRQLKEALYHAIIKYFDSGKMWENAVDVCKELAKQYEEHDFHQLSSLLRKMANFYDNILSKLRAWPEYFRVAYYGRGFPPFLQNKVFIYRGKEYERLSDFCTRTLNQLPKAELMNTLTTPGEDITESPYQYVQINKVEPIMDEKKQRSFGQTASSQVLKYHRVNNVQKFRFSRPYHKRDSICGDDVNEFATLWIERNILVTSYPLPGILQWFPVTSTHTYHLSPLANAIETMETTNEQLRELILEHKRDPHLPINPLSLKLNGIVDAAVMGGINNYEKAFFSTEYMEANPDKVGQLAQLKDLIASQIPLLEVGIRIHGDLVPPALAPFHQRLEQCFRQMQAHVLANYGAKTCDIKYESVALRRQTSTSRSTDTNRLSGTSFGSTEGSSRSRVSSLTKSQVATLKTFVNFASLSPSSTLTRTGSAYTRQSSASLSMTPSIGRKEKKKKRRHTNKERGSGGLGLGLGLGLGSGGGGGEVGAGDESPRPSSQWYTGPLEDLPTPTTPVFELSQQLTPTRPLRSEVERERRLSRPPSGQFFGGGASSRLSIPSTNGTNRDSLGTTDSTASEEDPPPPLPAKAREADYCNLPETGDSVQAVPTAPSTPRVRNKPVPPVPVEESHPPTPPPKRPLKFSPTP